MRASRRVCGCARSRLGAVYAGTGAGTARGTTHQRFCTHHAPPAPRFSARTTSIARASPPRAWASLHADADQRNSRYVAIGGMDAGSGDEGRDSAGTHLADLRHARAESFTARSDGDTAHPVLEEREYAL
ncbi:hypothetical protein B0H10DRAFT_2059396 [Mycena sp. CBHHK59/15]|nr:hypothetical protein B0H10DRAFT_2059396 [Mycena sp. CBHHK59/15]